MEKILAISIRSTGQLKPSVVGGLIHELGSKVAAVEGYVQELMQGLPETELKKNTQKSIWELRAGLELLQQWGMHRALEDRVFSLDQVFREAVLHLKQDFPGLEIDAVAFPGGKIVLKSDPELWKRVLISLLSNAVESYEGQKVRDIDIETQLQKGILEVTISDAGKGIPSRWLVQVFDPFFTTKGIFSIHPSGTQQKKLHHGLGLTLAGQIVESWGGELTLESAEGKGTKVRLRVPVEEGSS
jgi:signal transduction histidine kinase